jgi:REP element-mobilizing transposase RayT
VLSPGYSLAQIRFAYCYHLYLRWQTYRLRAFPALACLDARTLQLLAARFDLHILQYEASSTEVRTLASLRPQESVAACASKLKGQTSKWLRQALGDSAPAVLLSKGYFACTAGKSTSDQVDRYLADQGEHHGYASRVASPVFVRNYPVSKEREQQLRPRHAWTILRFHFVLATWRRRGVFGPQEAEAVTAVWRALEPQDAFALLKVSFLPDHVHLAVQVHPGVALDRLVIEMMGAAQKTIWEKFPQEAVRSGIPQLWQPSAYLGSFGDWATPQIDSYIRRWRAEAEA